MSKDVILGEGNDFLELVEDFKTNCGYNQKDAEIAARNVLREDQDITTI